MQHGSCCWPAGFNRAASETVGSGAVGLDSRARLAPYGAPLTRRARCQASIRDSRSAAIRGSVPAASGQRDRTPCPVCCRCFLPPAILASSKFRVICPGTGAGRRRHTAGMSCVGAARLPRLVPRLLPPNSPKLAWACDRGHVFNLVQDCALYGAALLGCWLMSTLCCSLRVPLSTCLWRSVLASSYLAGLGPGVITALRWMGPSAGCCTTRLARGPCSFCGGCSSSSGQLQPELARESEAGKQLRCYRRLLPEQNISCGRSTR